MSEPPAPARRLTDASKRKLNELIAGGMPLAAAMKQVSSASDAFEEVVPVTPKPPRPLSREPWKGDATNWKPVVEKLRHLKTLDAGKTVFGASKHQHELQPVVAERQLLAAEKKLGGPLPPGLRAFFGTVGDGGAGPGYGLYALASISRRKPTQKYPGIAALRELGAATKTQPSNPLQATVAPSRLVGAIVVMHHGCTIYSAIVCTGDVGRVVHFDEEGVSETDNTLIDEYDKWLDAEIAQFELVRRMREAGASPTEMEKEMAKFFPAKEAFRAKLEVEAKLRGLG